MNKFFSITYGSPFDMAAKTSTVETRRMYEIMKSIGINQMTECTRIY